MVKKIAIVGTAPSKRDAPYKDKAWEIWGCNRSCFDLKRWDRLFEIHRKWNMDSSLWDHDHKEYFEDLKAVKMPQDVVSTMPIGGAANLVIDRDALFTKYGAIWFSSSLAYMLAWALEQKPKEIGIWGVEMESHEEYVVQFAGCRHFIDLARALGIKVTMPDSCMLMREPHAYPDRFETVLALSYEAKARAIYNRLEKSKDVLWAMVDASVESPADLAVINRLRRGIERLRGNIESIQHFKRMHVWNVLLDEPPDEGHEDYSGPI